MSQPGSWVPARPVRTRRRSAADDLDRDRAAPEPGAGEAVDQDAGVGRRQGEQLGRQGQRGVGHALDVDLAAEGRAAADHDAEELADPEAVVEEAAEVAAARAGERGLAAAWLTTTEPSKARLAGSRRSIVVGRRDGDAVDADDVDQAVGEDGDLDRARSAPS